MQATLTLSAFGQTIASSGSTASAYQYAATSRYRNDGDAGLSLVGCRYYDAQVGQFVTRGTYLDQSPYAYCDGDPVDFLDPDGHRYVIIKTTGKGGVYKYPGNVDGVIIKDGGTNNKFEPVYPPGKGGGGEKSGGGGEKSGENPFAPVEEGVGEAVGDKIMEAIIKSLGTGLEF